MNFDPKPKDLLALILGIGLIGWGVITLGGLIWHAKNLSESGGEFFVTIGGVLAGGIITYLATKNGGNDK